MDTRYYDPVIEQFYSNDPKDAVAFHSEAKTQGFNRYVYAAITLINMWVQMEEIIKKTLSL